ncbi:hypothetical protein GCM10022262_23850 [Georgenia daeguensis]|uniref:Uncharacterized protein n=1 Tax=Georgenia daeguensis TaxID=908355 RepID=A0ABP8EVS4_9MICO
MNLGPVPLACLLWYWDLPGDPVACFREAELQAASARANAWATTKLGALNGMGSDRRARRVAPRVSE